MTQTSDTETKDEQRFKITPLDPLAQLDTRQVFDSIDQLIVHLKRKVRDNELDYHYSVSVCGNTLRWVSPLLWIPFNIQKYTSPGRKNKVKYSISVCLQSHLQEYVDFRKTLEQIDLNIMSQVVMPPDFYRSSICFSKSNPSLPPVLRIKIPEANGRLLIDAEVEQDEEKSETLHNPTPEVLTKLIDSGMSMASCTFDLNCVWCAGGRWGTSYRLFGIRLVKNKTRLITCDAKKLRDIM